MQRLMNARTVAATVATRWRWGMSTRGLHVDANRASIEKAIETNKVLVFSTPAKYGDCFATKVLLDNLEVEYSDVDLTEQSESKAIYEILADATKQDDLPMVFINGKHVGGYETMIELYASGKLNALLKE